MRKIFSKGSFVLILSSLFSLNAMDLSTVNCNELRNNINSLKPVRATPEVAFRVFDLGDQIPELQEKIQGLKEKWARDSRRNIWLNHNGGKYCNAFVFRDLQADLNSVIDDVELFQAGQRNEPFGANGDFISQLERDVNDFVRTQDFYRRDAQARRIKEAGRQQATAEGVLAQRQKKRAERRSIYGQAEVLRQIEAALRFAENDARRRAEEYFFSPDIFEENNRILALEYNGQQDAQSQERSLDNSLHGLRRSSRSMENLVRNISDFFWTKIVRLPKFR